MNLCFNHFESSELHMCTMIPVLLKYPSGPPTLISSDFAMSDVPKTISLPMQHYQEIVSDGDIGNMIWRLAWRFHECSMDL